MSQPNIPNADDVSLCSSLYWISGVLTLLRSTNVGATLIITKQKLSPELQMLLIEKYKISYLVNSPHQANLILKHKAFQKANLSSLKYLVVGGSKLPSHVEIALGKKLPNGKVFSLYGMTEVAGSITTDLMASKKLGTVGQLINNMCAKIVDDNGNRCGIGIDGEICIKTNFKLLGYYNSSENTDLFDEDEFLITGDIGHFDEDGFLCVIDRKKDLLKCGNFNRISPSEIESFLTKFPQIESACVVGITEEGNDLLAAVVVPNAKISANEIFNAVAGKILLQ